MQIMLPEGMLVFVLSEDSHTTALFLFMGRKRRFFYLFSTGLCQW